MIFPNAVTFVSAFTMYAFPHPHLEPKECLELNLLRFYSNTFQQELSNMKNFTNLEKFLKKLKKFYYHRIIKNEASVINFDHPQMRCSYIFHFAPCFSSIVAHYFSKLLHCLPWLTEKLLLADEINICCLGGGPATEFVAIAKVLEDMLWRYCPRSGRPLKLKATVIDINPGWRKTVKKISENLVHFVDTNLINCQVSFIQADLTKSLSEEVTNVLSCADIVTMSKFMTTIHGTCEAKDVTSTLQIIFQNVRQDGILLFLDSSGFENYNILRNVINSSEDLYQIYGLWEHEVYEMSQTFLEECYRFYSRFYCSYKPCCFRSRNYVSAWHRKQVSNINSEAYLKISVNEHIGREKENSQRSASF